MNIYHARFKGQYRDMRKWQPTSSAIAVLVTAPDIYQAEKAVKGSFSHITGLCVSKLEAVNNGIIDLRIPH